MAGRGNRAVRRQSVVIAAVSFLPDSEDSHGAWAGMAFLHNISPTFAGSGLEISRFGIKLMFCIFF